MLEVRFGIAGVVWGRSGPGVEQARSSRGAGTEQTGAEHGASWVIFAIEFAPHICSGWQSGARGKSKAAA